MPTSKSWINMVGNTGSIVPPAHYTRNSSLPLESCHPIHSGSRPFSRLIELCCFVYRCRPAPPPPIFLEAPRLRRARTFINAPAVYTSYLNILGM